MNPRFRLKLIATGLLAASHPIVHASGAHGAHRAQADAPAASAELTDGEVRKVDREAGKLTLRHAEIKSLDMPPMTMVFQVRDRAMLDALQVGMRVRFQAVHEAGRFVITELQLKP